MWEGPRDTTSAETSGKPAVPLRSGLRMRACGKRRSLPAEAGQVLPDSLWWHLCCLGEGRGLNPGELCDYFPGEGSFVSSECPPLEQSHTGLPGAISQWNPLSSAGHDIYLHWVILGPTGAITVVILLIYLHVFVEPGVSMKGLVLGWRSLSLRNKSWDRGSIRTAQIEEEDYREKGLRKRGRGNWVGRGQNGTFQSLSASALLGTSFEPQTQAWLKQTTVL